MEKAEVRVGLKIVTKFSPMSKDVRRKLPIIDLRAVVGRPIFPSDMRNERDAAERLK